LAPDDDPDQPGVDQGAAGESRDDPPGAVIRSIERPGTVVAEVIRGGGLQIVGKSAPLSRAQATELAGALAPAGLDHPWPDEMSSNRFGSSRDKVKIVKVEPLVVAEVLADTALHGGGYRHPLRFVRPRPDLSPSDVNNKQAKDSHSE
jgi:hypothetical protein